MNLKPSDYLRGVLALLVALSLFLLLQGCVVLPTVEPAVPTPSANATSVGTTPPTPTPSVPLVTVTGDVFVRDSQGVAQGYLPKGTTVYTFCSGEWCYLDGGLKFWRGCSSDNPYKLGCTQK